jgi:hypothetical protein
MADDDDAQDQDQNQDRSSKNSWLQSALGVAASVFQPRSDDGAEGGAQDDSASSQSADGSQGGMSSETSDGAPYSAAGTVPAPDDSAQDGTNVSSSSAPAPADQSGGVFGPPPPPQAAPPSPAQPPAQGSADPPPSPAADAPAPGTPDVEKAWQEGYDVGVSSGMPMCRVDASPEYEARYDEGYKAGKAKRDAVPDGPAVRKSRPDEKIVGRVISVLDDDGVGYHNKYFEGTEDELDRIQAQEAERMRQAVQKGLIKGLTGLSPTPPKVPDPPPSNQVQ